MEIVDKEKRIFYSECIRSEEVMHIKEYICILLSLLFIFVLLGCRGDLAEKEDIIEKKIWEKEYETFIFNSIFEECDENESGFRKEYIYLNDFDEDGIPELIWGNEELSIYALEDEKIKKIAEIESGNGIYFYNNCLICVSNGSDGSEFTCFTYQDKKYIIGAYSEYSPTEAILNHDNVTFERFNSYFNLWNYEKGKKLVRNKIYCEKESITIQLSDKRYTINGRRNKFDWDQIYLTGNESNVQTTTEEFVFLLQGEVVNLEKGGLIAYYIDEDTEDYRLVYLRERENESAVLKYTKEDIVYEFENKDFTDNYGRFRNIELVEVCDFTDDIWRDFIIIGSYERNGEITYKSRIYLGNQKAYELDTKIGKNLDNKINCSMERIDKKEIIKEVKRIYNELGSEFASQEEQIIISEEKKQELLEYTYFHDIEDKVTAEDIVNLRDIPSQDKDSTVLRQLKNSEIAVRTGVSDTGWSRLVIDGKVYYALTNYLTTNLEYRIGDKGGIKTQFTTVAQKVTPKIEVNLRRLPSVTDPEAIVVATAKAGEVFERTGINQEHGWSRVEYHGETLYCVSSYINIIHE